MQVTAKNDVYGFGVVALEGIKGKHPGDLISYCSLFRTSASSAQNLSLKNVLDERIPFPDEQDLEEVVTAIKIAFSFLSVKPENRPDMRKVSQGLSSYRKLDLDPISKDAKLGELFDFGGFIP